MDLVITDAQTTTLSADFIARLCAAYDFALKDFQGHGDSMWVSIDQLRQDIHDALCSRDIPYLSERLQQPMKTKLYYGVDELYDHGHPIGAHLIDQYRQSTQAMLNALATSTGLARLRNPEGGVKYPAGEEPPPIEIEALFSGVDALTHSQITFPNPFPEEIGLETTRGIATVRAVAGVYQAYRLQHMLRKKPDGKVLEIGGGMGRTAFYASRMGVRDYTLIDLPLSAIGQAVFLGLTLGEHMVQFANEPASEGAIRILTPTQFHTSDTKWDIALNVDSIPEMDRTHAMAYIDRLRQDKATFLSINHEANSHTVSELIPDEFRIYRSFYILRPGYVEELYDFS